MPDQTIWWTGFLVFVLAMLALDLGVFRREAKAVGLGEALGWSALWIGLALLFNVALWQGWVGGYDAAVRDQKAMEFLTGYVLEKSLSVDNVFVFAVIFTYFAVPATYQHRVLFWGIMGALIFRAIFIFAGIEVIKNFHWIIYVLGIVVVASGIKLWFSTEPNVDPEKNPVIKLFKKFMPVAPAFDGQRFFTRLNGKLAATPLFIVLLTVETTDVIFAVDSIPAILAITQDSFIVFTSNVFAILGLRALYFALAGIMGLFHYLHYGLSLLLVFIGTKMLLIDIYKIPIQISLTIVALVIAISIVLSIIFPAKKGEGHGAAH